MRMMRNADHVFFVDVESSLELAGGRGKAVQNKVLSHAVDPFAPRRH